MYNQRFQRGTYHPTLFIILDSVFMSLLEVTMKLFSVAPNEVSKIDDHFG